MKHLSTYLVLLLAIGLSACKEKTGTTEAKACEMAAMELYSKYADNTNLTVAYLGDLSINGKCIDALMLQANDETEWDLLKQDFGLLPANTDNDGCPGDDNVVSVGVGIEADFLDDPLYDTLTDLGQIPEEDIESLTLIVADKIRGIMNSFQSPDSLLTGAAIIIGEGEVKPQATDITNNDYLLTVSRAIVIGLINEKIAANTMDKSDNTSHLTSYDLGLQQQKEQGDRIMDNAKSQGHNGYITAADHDNRTLWLFFYDNQEECNIIITHIREDIIINE